MPVAFIFFSPLKRKALFTPVEVFAGKGELCMMGAEVRYTSNEISTVAGGNRAGTPSVIRRPCLQNTCPFNPPYPERAH